PIANQKLDTFRTLHQGPRQLPRLLGDPGRRRIRCAAGQMHTTAAQLDEKENVEPLQPDRLDREEIDRQHAMAWCLDELTQRHSSALAYRAETRLPQPCADRRRRQRDSNALQFADDQLIASPRVLTRETENQC